MRLPTLTAAAVCAVALSGSIASAGKLTPTANTSMQTYVPTGGNQPGIDRPYPRPAFSAAANEGRSAKHMRKHRAKKMMMKDSSGAVPGGAKPGVGGMGSPASK